MGKYIIYSCGISDCLPSWSWSTSEQGLVDYDLWAVFRGEGEIKIGTDKYETVAGDCFILPPNKKIDAHHNPDNPLLVINVHFLCEENSDIVQENNRVRIMRNPVFVKELLDRVILHHYKGEDEIAEIFFMCLLSELENKNSLSKNDNKNKMIIYSICDEINNNNSFYSLSYFANKYGYSCSYLGKLFSKTMGIDFSDYIINARINKSKILLRTSNYSINEIAEKLGYYDTSFFIKQFTKITNMTPGKYRNM